MIPNLAAIKPRLSASQQHIAAALLGAFVGSLLGYGVIVWVSRIDAAAFDEACARATHSTRTHP